MPTPSKNPLPSVADLERQQFSTRLVTTLEQAGYAPSPTKLAREFNARCTTKTVTIHAARKWLVGEAIPTQTKLKVLCAWLGVTPEWLRYGAESTPTESSTQALAQHSLAHQVAIEVLTLSTSDQRLMLEFGRLLNTIAKNQKSKASPSQLLNNAANFQ